MKSRHDCKLFIGGISARCESAELIEYFSKFGQVKNLKLTRNKQTGRCQGYGYLELGSHQTYSNILSAGEHIFQGRTIDVKKMIAKEKLQAEVENERNRRMFVGSLHPKTSNESLKGYFCQFGKVINAYIIMKPGSSSSKCFGYVTFAEQKVMDKVLSMDHTLDDNKIVVEHFNSKNAKPRATQEGSGLKSEKYGQMESHQMLATINNDHFVSKAHFKRNFDTQQKKSPAESTLSRTLVESKAGIQEEEPRVGAMAEFGCQINSPQLQSDSNLRKLCINFEFNDSSVKSDIKTWKIVKKTEEMKKVAKNHTQSNLFFERRFAESNFSTSKVHLIQTEYICKPRNFGHMDLTFTSNQVPVFPAGSIPASQERYFY